MNESSKKTNLRRRALTKNKKKDESKEDLSNLSDNAIEQLSRSNRDHVKFFYSAFFKVIGIIVLIIAARYVSWYLEMLHENLFWFTHIKEVEREISFRTEQGLYYSFYKQLINSGNLTQGFLDLQVDNITEYGRTINIFQRFNIYQELFLAYLYKIYDLQRYMTPILFYTKFVFMLQAFFAAGLYLTSWTLSRTHLAGILTLCLFIAHKNDASRVDYSVPLRECFSLPFVFCQMGAVTYYLKPGLSKLENIFQLLLILISTSIYTLTWQFAQFISLLQATALFMLAIVDQASKRKVQNILCLHMLAIMIVWGMQFYNPMLLTSLLVSFIPFGVFFLKIKALTYKNGIFRNMFFGFIFILLTVILSFGTNLLIKDLLGERSDLHIFKFIKGKLGIDDPRDFESRVYLCNDAFRFLDYETYKRLSLSLLFPFYCLTTFLLLSHLAYRTLLVWEFPDENYGDGKKFSPFAYHAVQSILFAILGSTTRRMICLWVPHMCIVGAAGVASPFLWNYLGPWCRKYAFLLRRGATTLLIAFFLYKIILFINEQSQDLNEFWDPDTVELMDWINGKTAPTAVFAGSMQLLAGVKLCTGRSITNHPHFEDQHLRQRTIQIYQMYSKQSAEHVYKILQEFQASYIILEDSLCLPSDPNHCHIIDILDLNNGHIPEHGPGGKTGLIEANHPRFCDQIREGDYKYTRYFKIVFSNKTFRVYKILREIENAKF